MRFYRLPSVLTALAGVSGGLFLTVFSGLYAVKPLDMYAEIAYEVVYFGFPFSWLEATRPRLIMGRPWVYRFAWHNFLIDFVIYGLLVSLVAYLFLARRRHSTSWKFEPPQAIRKTGENQQKFEK